MSELKTRAQVAPCDTWRLEDIYETDEIWQQSCEEAARDVARIAAFSGKLADRDVLKQALEAYFGAAQQCEKLYTYAKMRRDEDNARTVYQALVDRAQSLLVELGTQSAYLAPELLALSSEVLRERAADPAFADYKMYLNELERGRAHTLSAAEERIVAMAGEMSASPSTVYDMLTDADMRFPMVHDEQGNEVRLTHSNYIPLMMSRNRAVRKQAYEGMYETFKGYSATVPALYAASVKADLFAARTAKFSSALEASLFPAAIPTRVYDKLVEAAHGSLPALNRLVKLNAGLVGVEDPSFYDLYVPAAPGKFEINLPFREAYALVVDALGVLGAEYQAVLRRALDERWIDPYENQGKSSGAYSWGTYDTHPYVLLNYHADLDGLQTIAHEMGHSLHTHLSNAAQPYAMADYSLFVAEVASTVNEVLVLFELMDRHPEKEARAYLLYHLLDSYRTTLFRQTMFAEFERDAHAMAERGEALTCESLNKVYADLNALYYPCLAPSELIAYEWMRIPHFYRAFYVYQYATGFSSAMAIAGMIREEGAPAVERYLRFLSAGGSMHPLDALRLAGVDFDAPDGPVERALQLFERLVEQYEEVVK